MKYSAGFMYCGQSWPASAKCGIILALGPQKTVWPADSTTTLVNMS